MKKILVLIPALLVITLLTPTAMAQDLNANVKSSTVLIASYNRDGVGLGRGTGFFVDDGIVITNIHVIDGGAYMYRVYATGAGDTIDTRCYKDILRSDIKLNLEDDVAYLRVFIDCPHGYVTFADRDPRTGETIGMFGYPGKGTSSRGSLDLVFTPGTVLEETPGGINGELDDTWLRSDAKIYAGNSGGPVVMDGSVVGIAVAASMDASGEMLDSLFIPVSQIVRGLEYANDSSFGYTSRARHHLPEPTTTAPAPSPIPLPVPQTPATPPASSSSAPSSTKPKPGSFEDRVCKRVVRSYSNTATIWKRVNERIKRRFGFTCSK